MSLPPRPRVPAAARGGYGSLAARSSSPMAKFAGGSMGQGSQDSVDCEGLVDLEWMENGGVGLLRRLLIPPTDFNGQPSQAPFPDAGQPPQFPDPDAAQGVVEEELSGFDIPLGAGNTLQQRLYMVELRKSNGDTLEFHKFYHSISNGLKDVMWRPEGGITEGDETPRRRSP